MLRELNDWDVNLSAKFTELESYVTIVRNRTKDVFLDVLF